MKTMLFWMKTVLKNENYVQNEKLRVVSSQFSYTELYSCHNINMKFLKVVTPPSIYHYPAPYPIHSYTHSSLWCTLPWCYTLSPLPLSPPPWNLRSALWATYTCPRHFPSPSRPPSDSAWDYSYWTFPISNSLVFIFDGTYRSSNIAPSRSEDLSISLFLILSISSILYLRSLIKYLKTPRDLSYYPLIFSLVSHHLNPHCPPPPPLYLSSKFRFWFTSHILATFRPYTQWCF